MRILLDTHVLLWALQEPAKLSAPSRAAIASRENELLVSAATAWEIATKFRLGRLPSAAVIVQDYAAVISRLGAQHLAVEPAHALLAGGIAWEHRDPFDRMLAAQSLLEGVPLASADPVFATLPGIRVLWNDESS